MPDPYLTHLYTSLKNLNTRVEKLGRKVEELNILAYRYKRLSYEINQIDVMAFEIRQEYDHIREACARALGEREFSQFRFNILSHFCSSFHFAAQLHSGRTGLIVPPTARPERRPFRAEVEGNTCSKKHELPF